MKYNNRRNRASLLRRRFTGALAAANLKIIGQKRPWQVWLTLSLLLGLVICGMCHIPVLGLFPTGLLMAPFLLFNGYSPDSKWLLLFLYPTVLCALVLFPILFRRPDLLRLTAVYGAVLLLLVHIGCIIRVLQLVFQRSSE